MSAKKRGDAHCPPIYKYQKIARISPNGYLNFLTEYKKRFYGISPQDMVRFAAKQWNQLSPEEKERFKNMKEPVIVIKRPSEAFTKKSKRESSDEEKSKSQCQTPSTSSSSPCSEDQSGVDTLFKRKLPKHRERRSPNIRQKECLSTSTQESEDQSKRETPDRCSRKEQSQRSSPYSRERKSLRTSLKYTQSKVRNSQNQKRKRNSNTLGTACAYIHFLRNFRRKNSYLPANELLKRATRIWCRLDQNQRQQFERPLWKVKTG
ncbi:protamine-like protein 99C [Drosophila ficusphila]|uniref:protamine-like protein 99C n=1 Tax=Drosophila ficusphila TaxID=30025 RepID=UPI0007E79559|nr:protamine-like protein 99C [Drosophila ficusphila]